MDETTNKLNLNELIPILRIGHSFRAMIEMINFSKGDWHINNRINSILEPREVSIENKNIKKGKGYAAKAMAAGITNPLNLILQCSKFKNIRIVKQDILISAKDSLPEDKAIIASVDTICYYYELSSFVADIVIIPTINAELTKEFINNNLENIVVAFNMSTTNLFGFIVETKAMYFDKSNSRHLVETIVEINSDALPMIDHIDEVIPNELFISIIKQYFINGYGSDLFKS